MFKLSTFVGKNALRLNASQKACVSTAPEFLKIEKSGAKNNVAVITLNRLREYNALSPQLIDELVVSLKSLDQDDSVGAIVITGNEKFFSAGADVKAMSRFDDFPTVYKCGFPANWKEIGEVGKPMIAAVNGFCFGGACELALMCDIVYAGQKAEFAQPEINFGIIPGAGGTQRWARTAGKSMAMEVCLTGNRVPAQEAKECGMVSKVFPVEKVLDEAVKLGEKISELSPLIVKMCKEAVNIAYETTLQQGLQYERRLFHAAFATKDRKEGMAAFAEKRAPKWIGQ